ncbi:hypothetical protein GCM10010168_27250 [Actinoplanes ianthinogenes]|uniref:Uncharacterized protein n=1 Tax=Actinoplanes ianthinogenes TaxID=122358 RepID=A0ABM7LKV5_9ACTN|nr:hypothetical protein Aiant_05220 [Actinoplanes ianthinogenes]GGR08671.1 hypothetical protein GCM10010168_27250 [Actinoplanes ianthinogenes]
MLVCLLALSPMPARAASPSPAPVERRDDSGSLARAGFRGQWVSSACSGATLIALGLVLTATTRRRRSE